MRFPSAALAVLLLMACGGEGSSGGGSAASATSDATASTPAHLNACNLLTADDVGGAFGGTAFQGGKLQEHGTGEGEQYFSVCVFNADNATAIPTVSLLARSAPEVTDPAVALEAQAEDIRKNAVPDYRFDSVPSLGPGAGWDGTSRQLTVFRPGLMLILTAQANRGQDARAPLVSLAKTALQRTPGTGG